MRLETAEDAARAISEMWVRGAPLIGATAVYGLCLALREDASDDALARAYDMLLATRPTAVNLKWSLDAMRMAIGKAGANAHRIKRPFEIDGCGPRCEQHVMGAGKRVI